MILAVGYRVNSKRGIMFRRWANSILKQYLMKGYVINETRCIAHSDNLIQMNNTINDLNNRLTNVSIILSLGKFNISWITFTYSSTTSNSLSESID